MIEAGAVTVSGRPAVRPSQTVAEDAALAVAEAPRWVSRGALKLLHALDVFDLGPAGAEALDLGASTGGFTEVLLARGARRVHAVDAGRGQLHPRLAADPRVVPREGVNVRDLAPGDVPPPDWITADLSFISLEKALPAALALARPGATLVALVKPQFEAGRAAVGKGGIVKDPKVHAAVRARVRAFVEGAGWRAIGEAESPIRGGDGAVEFLIAARLDPGEAPR